MMNKTNKKKTAATPRRYDEAYKQEAIRLWQSSGQSAEHTARELGISVFNLYEWRKRADRLARAAGAAGLPGTPDALQAENERLRAELARMTEQRDILKKAAGILSEPSPRGMPISKR
jgi:transposase